MRLCRLRHQGRVRVGVLDGDRATLLPEEAGSLSALLHSPSPADAVRAAASSADGSVPLADASLLAPIDRQEVWAAGVTYKRSRRARMEESIGAASFYDKVYDADRPELFFKATAPRVVGPGEAVRVRSDSRWSVPEPELTLVIAPDRRIVGYTIGNDMSARDIEGENPLYLPQAKLYDRSAALGPCVVLADAMPPLESVGIHLSIERAGQVAFEGRTSVGQMKRTPRELVGWLGRENLFPEGVFLMTGTGIVPEGSFTLAAGDVVSIAIDGIGVLVNPVIAGG